MPAIVTYNVTHIATNRESHTMAKTAAERQAEHRERIRRTLDDQGAAMAGLVAETTALRTENSALRAEIDALKSKLHGLEMAALKAKLRARKVGD